jgi:hypothetical protein
LALPEAGKLPFLKGGIIPLFAVTPPPSTPPLKIRGGRGSYDSHGASRDFKIMNETFNPLKAA